MFDCDWSSDVCSSILAQGIEPLRSRIGRVEAQAVQDRIDPRSDFVPALALEALQIVRVAVEHLRRCCLSELPDARRLLEIGRAACRERPSISVVHRAL